MLEGLAAFGPEIAWGVAVLSGAERDDGLRQLHAQGVRGARLTSSPASHARPASRERRKIPTASTQA